MTSPASTDPDDAMLRRLAEMDMAAAEKAHAALMAAEDAAEIAHAMRAYQRAARSVRQTLMLKGRLGQMAVQAAPPPPLDLGDPRVRDAMIIDRVYALQDAVGRVIAASHPGDEARHETLQAAHDEMIDADAERPDFLRHPLAAQVLDQCHRLGLPGPLAGRWRVLPPAPWSLAAKDDEDADLIGEPPPALRDSG